MSGRIVIAATVAVVSPFLFPSLEPSAHGIDASPLRTPDGFPVLPGDHLRGHLRHAASALYGEGSDEVRALFGRSSDSREEGGSDRPERGALLVGDLVARDWLLDGDPRSGRQRVETGNHVLSHRVAIDEESGAADDGMLQVIELALPPAAIGLFEGDIVIGRTAEFVRAFGDASPGRIIEDLMTLVAFVGANKTAGYGAIRRSSCRFTERPVASVAPAGSSSDRVQVDLAFDQPILVDARRLSMNLVAGADIIPGAALKGAVARFLDDLGLLGDDDDEANDALSALRFSHAFPVFDGKLCGMAVPDALAATWTLDEDNKIAEVTVATCVGGEGAKRLATMSGSKTPAYPGDWKGGVWSLVRNRLLDRPDAGFLRRQGRGRVAIGPDGLADEGKLFVTELVETHGLNWRFELARGNADRRMFDVVVGALVHGLHGLGRTGAHMKAVTVSVAPQPQVAHVGEVALLLETPLVIGTSDETGGVHEKLAGYFQELFDGTESRLMESVARRRIAGDYLGFRFPRAGSYRGFEMVEPGAVFVLDLDPAGAVLVSDALSGGLPARFDGHMRRGVSGGRSTFPLTPQNGYGAVSLLPAAFMDGVHTVAATSRESGA